MFHHVTRITWLSLAFAALMAPAGCSGSNVNLSLRYEPSLNIAGDKAVKMTVVEFADTRSVDDPRDLGNNRSLIGMSSGRVLANEDPAIWVTNALVAELTHAGFKVERAAAGTLPASAPVVVTGDLQKCSVSRKGTSGLGGSWSTTIKVKIIVTKNGETVHERRYIANEKEGSKSSSAAEVERELEKTLRKLLKRATPDLVQSMG